MRHHAVLLAVLLTLSANDLARAAEIPERALELHQRGFAELENEKPENAAPFYREVIQLVPDDPLGYANLAIAELRQQKHDVARRILATARTKFPDHPRLLAIEAELLQWSGDLEGSLALLDQASRRTPDDLELLYAAYHAADTVRGDAGDAVAERVLGELAARRPENVVVLLQLGQRAIAGGDRAKASGAFLRIGELLWQEKEITRKALGMVLEKLEGEDVAAARVPAMRLENVLKVSPMFRESLRELKTGIQGIPLERFETHAEPEGFGPALEITFQASRLDAAPTTGGLAVGDFDGDDRADIARVLAAGGGTSGAAQRLEIRTAATDFAAPVLYDAPAGSALDTFLLAIDLDNDGFLDLLAGGASRAMLWRGVGDGRFVAAPGSLGLEKAGATAAAAIDFDIEGDLDLALAGGASGLDLYRADLQGDLERVGDKTFPKNAPRAPRALAASDLDRDGDLDLAALHAGGVARLDNLRQGRFTIEAALPSVDGAAALAVADLDNDARPDLVTAGRGLRLWRGDPEAPGHFVAWTPNGLPALGGLVDVLAFDADNDGRLDLAAVGSEGFAVAAQDKDGFRAVDLEGAPSRARHLAAADLDGDGDLDLVAAGAEGLHRLENRGGDKNGWLAVRLRGLDKGNSKNNLFGVGSLVEIRDGRARQFREAAGDVVHFGLGTRKTADILRVVWTNGVPQNRLDVAGNQRIVEEQVLKGSCPFVYVWNGESFIFGTDLLWGAPIGLPVAPGVWAAADPDELVRLDGLVADDGAYSLRLTEELWEAAFFDHLRLWVVDHPAQVETASNLRIVPGPPPATDDEDRVLAGRALRAPAGAWDGQGRDVTEIVRARDEVYADGYRASAYQGVAAEPWAFTLDLGETVPEGTPLRLHLDGWIFPADASLNLAVAQREDLPYLPPRLEVETANGWQTVLPAMGFPAGKTKTTVIDVPVPEGGVRRLRMVSNLWLHWDRIAWTTEPADDAVRIVAKLLPSEADLRYRGFSAVVRKAPNAPHTYDYAAVRTESPWLTFPGKYTRFGDVRDLLVEADDRSVILAPGDEIAIRFDAAHLPPPPDGWTRTLYLESHGWDKDADRNTFEGEGVEPLPFRAMTAYGEPFPDTEEMRRYREEWLTREMR